MAPHIVLCEIGKKFNLEKVDLGTKKTGAGKDFNKINPKGYLPALKIKKGELMTECAVIMQYLADKAKAVKLAGKAGSVARYRTMEWLNFIAAELHKSMGALFNKTLSDDARKAAGASGPASISPNGKTSPPMPPASQRARQCRRRSKRKAY